MNKIKISIVCAFILICTAQTALAHTLYMSVQKNDDQTALVTGMFSTGATAAGLEFRLEDKDGKILLKDKMDEFGEYTFKIPDAAPYYVIIDGGPGHVTKEQGPKKE